MIVIYHKDNKVVSVRNLLEEKSIPNKSVYASKALFEIASLYPEELIVWCHISQKEYLNLTSFSEVFHHQKIMASYHHGARHFFSDAIGYVEQSPFIKISKKVCYPTWQMSSCVGGIFASILNALPKDFPSENNFDFFLNSLGKQGMPIGLLCYSEPKLLIENSKMPVNFGNRFNLFRFVKQHFKTRWVFLLFLNLLVYEKKIAMLPLMYCLFFKKRFLLKNQLDTISVASSKIVTASSTIDVIIPTNGRKKYLYDVLCDLRKQTLLPVTVIIVEQNPVEGSISELDYLQNEAWPFKIDLTFTHQTGACNARNIALEKVKSEWVFFADDDIRLGVDFLKKAFLQNDFYKVNAYSLACNTNKSFEKGFLSQTTLFSSGCSIVLKDSLKHLRFSLAYEFGFGEDSDFGMQLRNSGFDVLYFPEPEALHLKAPIGGFRNKPSFQWDSETIKPKPSPTVLLYKLLHTTDKQIRGYKTTSFFKFYKEQTIKNPVRYYRNFKKQWEKSFYWAKELRLKKE